MSRLRPSGFVLLAGIALIPAGCGSDTAMLTGTVRYNRKPLTSGSVILYCADKQIVRGIIDTEGNYAIPNVPHGVARVTVQSHTRIPEGLRPKQVVPPFHDGPKPVVVHTNSGEVTPIPLRYSHPEESGLSVTVDRNAVQFEIDLTP